MRCGDRGTEAGSKKMTDIVEQARKVVELRGDTYSSYEVVGLLGQLVAEVERLQDCLQARDHELQTVYGEIERLRTTLKNAPEPTPKRAWVQRYIDWWDKNVSEMVAEFEWDY
jgi:hypothetical protein